MVSCLGAPLAIGPNLPGGAVPLSDKGSCEGGIDLAHRLARIEQQHELQLQKLDEHLDLMRQCLLGINGLAKCGGNSRKRNSTASHISHMQSTSTADVRAVATALGDIRERHARKGKRETQISQLEEHRGSWKPLRRYRRAVTAEMNLLALLGGRRRAWGFLEDPVSSIHARAYAAFVMVLVMAGVCNFGVEVLFRGASSFAFTLGSQVFFTVEFIVRLVVCPTISLLLVSPYAWLDLLTTAITLSIVFTTERGTLDAETVDVLHACCQVFLLLKLLRRSRKFHLLVSAFRAAAEALPVLLCTLLILCLTFSGLVYLVEPRDNVPTFGSALWLVVVTLGTIGYGDVAPVAAEGQVVVSILIITGGLYTAIPIGLVGSSFSAVWEDRERLMLLQHIRKYIGWAGFTVNDIASMFAALDSNRDSVLSFDEFKTILPLLEVDLNEGTTRRLFQMMDADNHGTIDLQEFLYAIFPMHRFFLVHSRLRDVTDDAGVDECAAANGVSPFTSMLDEDTMEAHQAGRHHGDGDAQSVPRAAPSDGQSGTI